MLFLDANIDTRVEITVNWTGLDSDIPNSKSLTKIGNFFFFHRSSDMIRTINLSIFGRFYLFD